MRKSRFPEVSRRRTPWLWLVLVALLSSCAFDRRFLAPEVIPPQAKQGIFVNPVTKDTTYVLLEGPAWQPTFADRERVPVDRPYSIQSSLITTLDGHRLNAWTMRPTKRAEKPITILFLHGNGGNITTEYEAAAPMVERGYRVILFDYSGYGFSTGRASRKWLMNDARAAFEQARLQQEGQPERKLVIYGQSLGGHLAVLLAAEVGKNCDALIIEGAFTSYDDIAASSTKLGLLARVATKGGPSAKDRIASVTAPVLIVHSRQDKTIPFEMGELLFAKAAPPKDFFAIEGPHCTAPILYADSLCARIERLVP